MRPVDDTTIRRWMALDARGMNAGLTATQLPLSTLLRAEAPVLPTQSGGRHVFDREALEAFAALLSPFLRGIVSLPVRLYVSHQHAGEVSVADAEATQALVESGLVHTRPRAGRLWMTMGTARALVGRFPTVFQFVYV